MTGSRIRRSQLALALLLAAWGCTSDFSAPSGGGSDGSPEMDGAPAPDGEPLPTACLDALAAAAFDFESGPAGWTHDIMPEIAGTAVDWRFDDWEHGTASSVGPAACHGGTGCWATRLDNNYIACQRAYLMSPPLDLAACSGEDLALSFQHFYDFWTDEWEEQTWFDGGIVELSADGADWAAPPGLETTGIIAINPSKNLNECIEPDAFHVDGRPGFVGESGGWAPVEVAIPAELVAGDLYLRFSYSSGVILESSTQNASNFFDAGWYIDDLAIVAAGGR
jgi:hypothetical protein